MQLDRIIAKPARLLAAFSILSTGETGERDLPRFLSAVGLSVMEADEGEETVTAGPSSVTKRLPGSGQQRKGLLPAMLREKAPDQDQHPGW